MQTRISFVKKFFSSSSLRYLSFLLPVLVLVFLLVPQAADAGLGEIIGGAFKTAGLFLLDHVLGTIFGLIATVLGFIFNWVSLLLIWAIKNLMTVSVYPGPTFVQEGWKITSGLVNAVLLVILVFIGLATILRLGEYQGRQILVRFILIALLVNFSGVLVGLVVDIANIITNFFLQAIQDIDWRAVGWQGSTGGGLTPTEELGLSIGQILFFGFAILILWATVLVFLLRMIILWVLVILAPLAFAAYILPTTRGLWSKWWSSLVQWAFIGLPISFFLFLAGLTLSASAAGEDLFPEAGAGTFSSFFAPLTALVLMFLGLSFGIFGQWRGRVTRFAGRAGAVAGGVLARDLIRNNLAKSERAQRLTSKMENFTSVDSKSRLGKTLGRASAPLIRYTGRKAGSQARAGLKQETDKAEAEVKDWTGEEMASHLKGNISDERKIGILNQAAKSGKIDDVMSAGFDEPKMREVYDKARKRGHHQDIQAALPHFVTPKELQQSRYARDNNKPVSQVTAAEARTIGHDKMVEERDRLFKRMSPERAKWISSKAVDNPEIAEAMIRNFNGTRVGNLASSDQGQEAVVQLQKSINDGWKTFKNLPIPGTIMRAVTASGAPTPPKNALEWLAFQPNPSDYPSLNADELRVIGGNNPQLAHWINTTPGRTLGFTT